MSTRTPGARRGFARIGLMSALALLGTSFLLAVTEPGARSPQVAYVQEVTLDNEAGVIGAAVRGRRSSPGYVRVEDVFPNMPAWQAGLQPGDLIVEVDGHSMLGMGESVVRAIRGGIDTPVHIRVLREDEPDPLDFTLTRVPAPAWYPPSP